MEEEGEEKKISPGGVGLSGERGGGGRSSTKNWHRYVLHGGTFVRRPATITMMACFVSLPLNWVKETSRVSRAGSRDMGDIEREDGTKLDSPRRTGGEDQVPLGM